MAAAEKNLPMFVPGWEDSTLGNMFAAQVISGKVKNVHTVRVGIEYMMELARWYTETAGKTPLGFSKLPAASREISHLRGADAPSGFAPRARSSVGVFLPDQRFHDQLWFIFRSGAQ